MPQSQTTEQLIVPRGRNTEQQPNDSKNTIEDLSLFLAKQIPQTEWFNNNRTTALEQTATEATRCLNILYQTDFFVCELETKISVCPK